MLSSDKWFYFAGGRVAKDIPDIIVCLKEISEQEFIMHVNSSKNDFANWVEGVFGYGDLSYQMRHVMEKKDTITLLRKFLYLQKSHSEDQVAQDLLDSQKHDDSTFQEAARETAKVPVFKTAIAADSKPLETENFEKVLSDTSASVTMDADKLDADEHHFTIQAEHDLEEEDLRSIALDASQEIHIEGRMIEDRKKAEEAKQISHHLAHHKFIVREFIYGFFLGMIFGLIMLGTIQNMI